MWHHREYEVGPQLAPQSSKNQYLQRVNYPVFGLHDPNQHLGSEGPAAAEQPIVYLATFDSENPIEGVERTQDLVDVEEFDPPSMPLPLDYVEHGVSRSTMAATTLGERDHDLAHGDAWLAEGTHCFKREARSVDSRTVSTALAALASRAISVISPLVSGQPRIGPPWWSQCRDKCGEIRP